MKAAILAVGAELLGTDRLDTNSLVLTEVLERHGATLVNKVVVGDDEQAIAAWLRRSAEDAELVLVTGGLGPTGDDRTRAGVALALGRGITLDATVLADIEGKFARLHRRMPEVNRRQAEVLEGAVVLENPRGTAPGLRLEEAGRTYFLFPGVPHEMAGLAHSALEPWLRERSGGREVEGCSIKVACLAESQVEELVAPVYERFGRDAFGVYPAPGDIELRVRVAGTEDERRRRLQEIRAALLECVGAAAYSATGEDLETVLGRTLAERGATVGTAESCTAGLVAERLTRVAGSSAYFVGSLVTYSNRAKQELLGVAPDLLERHGAVSREVVESMAHGARDRLGCDWAVAVSGIAGPGGGSSEKPVGTVHMAVAGAGTVRHRQRRFPGNRRLVRELSAQFALDMLRRELDREEQIEVGR